MKLDRWYNSPVTSQSGNVEYKLHQDRSQASCCVFEDDVIFVFGGYNRELGTLNTIEKFEVTKKKMVKNSPIIRS